MTVVINESNRLNLFVSILSDFVGSRSVDSISGSIPFRTKQNFTLTSGHGDCKGEFDNLEKCDVQRLRDRILSPVAVPHAVVGALLHSLRHNEEADEGRRLEREARLARHFAGHILEESTAQRGMKLRIILKFYRNHNLYPLSVDLSILLPSWYASLSYILKTFTRLSY